MPPVSNIAHSPVSNNEPRRSARKCTCTCSQHPTPIQSFYPTPPASPDLIDTLVVPDPAQAQTDFGSESNPPTLSPLPIPILLDTPHSLPYASTLRLASASSLLGTLGNLRLLELSGQSLWDRMPSRAMSAVVAVEGVSMQKGEEARVERMLGGKAEPKKMTTREHIRSIFVQPPTPERETPPSPTPIVLPPVSHEPPAPKPHSSPIPAHLPLHVLPEVRSPPKRSIALAADSLQLNLRRGRRPRLFGFTEMPESGSSASSAASSAANSRSNSPERKSPLGLSIGESSTSAHTAHAPSPGSALPRRGPLRTRSDTHLPTIASSMSITPSPRSATHPAPKSPTHPASESTSLPTPRRKENGLKLDFTGIVPLNAPIDSSSTYVPSPYSAKLIRKKSGELVKPALKYSGPLTAGGTPMFERQESVFHDTSDSSAATSPTTTGFPDRLGSKSLPATPSFPKYVHFDSQLERVKLFNKDHKPQVVSRDGSPTQYTTSEGEEFPFPSTDDEATARSGPSSEERKVLSIRLPNFPATPDLYSDLQLESLQLDDDRKSIRGVVIVKNFAFTKWVAVRFTFDWWQTTSEVSATHKETIRDGAYDRFGFTIKLGDMMSRIEEKTLFMCVRYNSEGREVWDSNNGENYQVNFERRAPAVDKASLLSPGLAGRGGKKMMNQWGSAGKVSKRDDRMADLREKLSRLTAEDEALDAPPLSPNRSGFLSAGKKGVNFGFGNSPSSSPRKGFSSLADEAPTTLPNQGLAARYDFGTAFNAARSPSPDTRELPSVRTGLIAFESPNKPERPGMDYYSPRYTPSGLPETSSFGQDFFAPSSGPTYDSPNPMSNGSSSSSSKMTSPLPAIAPKAPTPLDIPDLTVQGPSPPPPESPVRTIAPASTASPRSPARPTLSRNTTSPAVLTTSLSPRGSPKIVTSNLARSSPLAKTAHLPDLGLSTSRSPSPPFLSGSATSTEQSDSPRSMDQTSPPDLSLSRFVASRDRGSADSVASYSSFIEQFCWGGAPTTTTQNPSGNFSDMYGASPPRRVQSSSSLDEYFARASSSAGGSGFATPRAPTPLRHPPQTGFGGFAAEQAGKGVGFRPLVSAQV